MIPSSPESFYNVSNSQLSVARHFGGCTFNGCRYVYLPDSDELVRADIFESDENAKKEVDQAERKKWKEIKQLFEESQTLEGF